MSFVHLHVHTDYSLLDGIERCSDICKQAKEFGMPAVAVTDHGNMSACYEIIKEAKKAGIKAILGCEFYVAPGDCHVKDNKIPHYQGYHLVCLAENHEGYVNLCHLNEEAWLRGYYYKPRIDKALLRKYSKGIIALSACLSGELAADLAEGKDEEAELALLEYVDIFGKDNFFVELQDHGLEEQKATNPRLIALAKKHGLGLVVTNDAHYLKKEHAEAHDLFLCIGTQSKLSDPNRMRFTGTEFYFKSPEEMAALFPEYPECVENTLKIAERCNVHLATVDDDKANHYPEYPVPEGVDRRDYLFKLCLEGLPWRYGFTFSGKDEDIPTLTEEQQVIVKRMNYELGIIAKTAFVSYFLVVWDFLHYAAKIGVPLGPGRGSGAGSIVAYLLGITHIDPLRYKLLFERFLNPDRVSPPDFDIDLCERRRHEVIEYVRDKYGADRVVQIGTFGTLKAKAVIKDVCRALGRPPEEANSLTKLIPNHPKMTLKKALEGDSENKIPPSEELKQLLETEPWVQEVWKYAEILEGLNRNMSIHAAGVIIGDMPVAEVAPIAKGAGDEPITQFSAVPCEQLGLLKMDFLGLKTLTLIQDALDLVEKNTGKHIESNEIQLGDKPTYDLLNAGKTIAVFQLESPGMQKLCLRYGINRLEDLIALIALYRPGPLEFLEDFLARKQGRKAIEYDVPEMEPILEETFGIMLYQEQIMQVVQVVAGFSLGQADILRRAMGKKKKDVMNEMFGKFKDGCLARGIDEATVKAIWDKIFAFAGYGFNKSHSAAYGMLTYRTAWLKANYPAEFMAAVLTGELGNSEKLSFYLKECRAMNIKIMPPDVNVCDASFSVDGPNIRFGLVAVRGINSAFVNSIITAREKGGKFKDLLDFCERVEGNSVRNMEGLIKAGALDSFGLRRSQLLAVAAKAISIAKDSRKDKINGQMSLFDMLGGGEQNASGGLDIPDIPEWPLDELLGYEKELLGFFVSGHPISKDQAIVERYQLNDLSELVQLESGTMVRIGAYLTGVQQKTTKRGEPWVILNLENRETSIEGLMFHESFAKCKEQGLDALKPDSVVFVEGEVNRREPESEDEVVEDTEKVPETKLFVYRVVPAAKAMDAYTSEIHLRLQEQDITEEKLGGLRQLCEDFHGETPAIIGVACDNGDKVFLGSDEVQLSNTPEFRKQVHALFGDDCLYYKPNRIPPKNPSKRGHWKPRPRSEN